MDNANFAIDISVQNMWCQPCIPVLQMRFEWAEQCLNKAKMSDIVIGYLLDLRIG
jgi:hypothetical protein